MAGKAEGGMAGRDQINIYFPDNYVRPLIVTYVLVRDDYKAISARLDLPIRNESGSLVIDATTLKWKNILGEIVPAPKYGTPLILVYVEGEYSQQWLE